MASDIETRSGGCPAHGTVEGTREVPRLSFPFVVNAIRRYLARRRPFRCPECGNPIATG